MVVVVAAEWGSDWGWWWEDWEDWGAASRGQGWQQTGEQL